MTNGNNTPKRGRQNNAKKKKTMQRKRVTKIILSLLTVCVIAVICYGVYFVLGIIKATDEFDVNRLVSNEPTEVYDATGTSMGYLGNSESGSRENVTSDQLPQVLIDAVVAAEDSRFFEHNGFDLPRIVSAAIGNIFSGDITSGGSTITQQLIKNSYWSYAEQNINIWQRKIAEIYLAVQADRELSKEDILTLYLNKIPFGRGTQAIGIQAACKYYFDKEVSEITLPEAALLAGTLNAPDAFDPYYHIEKATARRNVILELMYRHGYITEEEMNITKEIKVENTLKPSSTTQNAYSEYASYIDTVLREFTDLQESGEFPQLEGLNPLETPMEIYTFMDPETQAYADQIASGEAFNFGDDNLEVGASVQDSHTGAIVAVIGGRSYAGITTPEREAVNLPLINYAFEKHQPGSSLKPIISYAAAFQYLDWSTGQSISNDVVYDASGKKMDINNWDMSIGGEVQLDYALRNSYNLPAIHTFDDVQKEIGLDAYLKYVQGFGFDMTESEISSFNSTYSIGNWDVGISPIEGAGAYAALSNSGNYIQPHTINYIVIKDTGEKIDIHNAITPTHAVDEGSAFMIQKVLSSFTKSAYVGTNIPYNIAGKTGTTDWGNLGLSYGIPEGVARDSWFQCYTEDYAVSVWIGYPGALSEAYGYYLDDYQANNLSTRLGAQLISQAHKGTTRNSYTQPSTVTQSTMVKGVTPYIKPTSDTPSENIITAWFKTSNLPKDTALSSQLNPLTSFDVTGDVNNLNVTFGEYGEDDETAEKLYGKVMYGVEVRDSETGEILHTQTSDTTSFKLNYVPEQSVLVVGFYTRENASSIRSSEKSVSIEVEAKTARYTVRYYTDGRLTHTEVLEGEVGSNIEVNSEKYLPDGYTVSVDPSYAVVKEDNSVVINVYYTREQTDNSQDNNQNNNGNNNQNNENTQQTGNSSQRH